MMDAKWSEHLHGEHFLPRLSARRGPVAAGLAAAALTVILLVAWKLLSGWYIFASAYTDLPGQDSLALVSRLQVLVFALIALVSGRVAGLLCPTRPGVATLIGVSPLLLPAVLLFLGFRRPLEAALVASMVCLIGLLGAYGPGWLLRGRVRSAV
jgi:hypothetical protein